MAIPKDLEDYADKLGYPGSETLGRIFEILFQGEGVSKLLQAMPGTLPELAARTGWSVDKVLEVANPLLERGAIGHPIEKPDVYHMFSGMIEMRDASIIHPNAPQELVELWEKLQRAFARRRRQGGRRWTHKEEELPTGTGAHPSGG